MKKKYSQKHYLLIMLLIIFNTSILFAQQDRMLQIKTKLESIVVDTPGLTENVEVNVNNISLPEFLQTIAYANNVNLNISSGLETYSITNNFSNATVLDVFLFVCKEYNLDIDFIGNILSIRKHQTIKEIPKHRDISILYNAKNELFSVDLKKDTLYVAFKQIMDKTGENLVFSQGMGNLTISSYIQNMPFDGAMDKIAFSNDLTVTKTRDNYYLFERNEDFGIISTPEKKIKGSKIQQKPKRKRRSNFYFKVKDTMLHTLDVDFENTPISNIVYDIGLDLKLNMFTSTPLDQASTATVKAKNISFDLLLNKIFENTSFTFKKENNIYFFGDKKNISLRNSVVVPLQHRSIEVMNTNGGGQQRLRRSSVMSNRISNTNYLSSNNNSNNSISTNNSNRQQSNINTSRSNSNLSNYNNQTEALINIIPDDITNDLDIKVDIELNSFIVSGPSQNIERFKTFITSIDKPVPVILIEVMVIEVNKNYTIETGITAGIGEAPTPTQGKIFPNLDISLGASTINNIIVGFNGFGSLNLGQVIPNFYLQLKAMEKNGNIKIRSSPKLSTLNGHRASLSIGETTYYAVTERNIYGSLNPQTSEITNYVPIDAEFAVNIKPLVSGDGQITLDINVIQSTFNGIKIAAEAPPGMNSREFNSIIRVKDRDLVILGGLEKQVKNDSGSGVPILSRIPVLKWFFSSKERTSSKNKLTILIKPTVLY
ncbi:MAG: type II and III secretion system protein [Flavobacteriaceae bacterium]|nr:type II and III secretion system protein [Flavobacteriaceae bacterium]